VPQSCIHRFAVSKYRFRLTCFFPTGNLKGADSHISEQKRKTNSIGLNVRWRRLANNRSAFVGATRSSP
jgi:hypothetical protein